jgi:hypothetical protein
MARYPGFVGPSATGRSWTAATDRSINWYPELAQYAPAPESPIQLRPTPGYKLFGTLPSPANQVESLYSEPKSGRVFSASQGVLYELDSGGGISQLGLLGSGPYSFASNPAGQVMICSGGTGASVLLTGMGLMAPSGTFLGSALVDYSDAYFIILVPHSQQFQISQLLDGLAGWSGLDFGSAYGSAEDVVALKVLHRELWVFGTKRGEVYANTGNPSFPFERVSNVYIEQGIKAPQTLRIQDNTLFWLGEDRRGQGIVWRAEGYTPKRISTHALEYWIAKYAKEGRIDDAAAYAYQEEGHFFYMLHFPSANPIVTYMGYNLPVTVYQGAAWCYDCTTAMWHERLHWDSVTTMWQGFRGRSHCFGFGKQLIGDWKSGKIYEMSSDFFDDAGDPLRRVRVAPHVTDELKRIFYNQFRLNIQVGEGSKEDLDPHIALRMTDDGGKTWSSERGRSLGKQGRWNTLVRWNQLGAARRRAFEVSTTAAVPVTLLDAYLELEEGLD